MQNVWVSFSSPPADFRLSYLGKTLLEGHGPQLDFAVDASVDLPKEGADFALEARWPVPEAGSTPAARHVAVRVVFKRKERTFEQTVWSDGDAPMVELVTVPP